MNVNEIVRLRKAVAKTKKDDCETVKCTEVKEGDRIVWDYPLDFKTSLIDEVVERVDGFIDYQLHGRIVCRRDKTKTQIILKR